MRDKRLWSIFATILIGTFLLLGFFGLEIYRRAPPIPDSVVDERGNELSTRESILDGQQAWQSMGGSRSARYGAMARTRRLIGLPIGCTANRSPC